MKKTLLLLSILTLCVFAALSVVGKKQSTSSPKSEAREVREQRRAARQAATEKMIDSLVLAHSFQFRPQSMQQEISGGMNILANPNFEVGIWDGSADIFLPYIKGIAPPYRHVILNYTVTMLNNYTTEQTDNGWIVSFTTNLYSSSDYTFIFDINTKYGSTTLTIKSVWYESVKYVGWISQYY